MCTKAHIHTAYQLLWSDCKCNWTAEFSKPLQYQISRKSITQFSTRYIHTVRNDTVPSSHPTLSSLLYPLQPQQVCINQLVNVISINISVNILTVANRQKYKDVCWKAKRNSPKEMYSRFNHGTSMALTTAYFCNTVLQTHQQRNKQNTEGQKPHNSVYTYLLKI